MTRPALPVRALVALSTLLAAAPALAQLYDPAYHWRTLQTAHFRVHYHQGEEAMAQEVAQTAERAHAVLAPVLGYAPRSGTEIVLSDDTDEANGLTTPVPYDTIRLYATTPSSFTELAAYRDWLAMLVFHEYVHVLHMDDYGGFPGVLNRVFGKIWPPNALVPAWMTEGLAVLHEADGQRAEEAGSPRRRGEGEARAIGTPAGRASSTLHAMEVRALCTEPGGFPTLPQASNPALEWPVGNVPYLLGGRFMTFLRQRFGDPAIAGFIAQQGRQLWPYAPSHAGSEWFGTGFPELWQEYAAEEQAAAAAALARIRARPVTRPRRLTIAGGRAGWPRWTPDGSAIAYLRTTLDDRPGLFQVTPDGRELGRVLTVDLPGGLALRADGDAVLSMGNVWREHRLYDDLWRVSLRRGTRTRLTGGARASDPALTPDGTAIVYVKRPGPGRMALVRRALAGGPEEVLLERAGAQLYSPAVSPDGKTIALELHEDGRRDVVLLKDGALTRVTDDAPLDLGPAFTPDGRWLLFSSDRTGVFNLYAWPVGCDPAAGACAVRQVTNVESGAFQPAVSPDGKTIALVTYGRDGYDLATLPFDEASWIDAPPAPAAAPLPAPPAAAELAARPYDPLPTVLPHYWLPILGADVAGPTYGALTAGSDVVGLHQYAAQAWWSERARDVGYSAAYLGGWSFPQVDLSSSRVLLEARAKEQYVAAWTPADVGLDFTFRGLGAVFALRAGWSGTLYDVLKSRGRATSAEDLDRADGFLSQVSFAAAYSDARRPVRAISPEEGRTLGVSASVGAPELGSDFALARVRGAATQYLRVPFTRHAVIAVRAAGGAADHTIGAHAPFELGGLAQPNAAALLLSPGLAAGDELRGYSTGFLKGSGYALANLELRVPIASPEWGRTTWPIFLRRVHAAAFADLGQTWDVAGTLPLAGHRFRTDAFHLGVGLEGRAEVALGYHLLTDVRLGVAAPLGQVFRGESREPGQDPVTAYVTVGQAY